MCFPLLTALLQDFICFYLLINCKMLLFQSSVLCFPVLSLLKTLHSIAPFPGIMVVRNSLEKETLKTKFLPLLNLLCQHLQIWKI